MSQFFKYFDNYFNISFVFLCILFYAFKKHYSEESIGFTTLPNGSMAQKNLRTPGLNSSMSYAEVGDFGALSDAKLVRAVLKHPAEAGEGQFASLHRQEGHKRSRVRCYKHKTHYVGREVNNATRPGMWHRFSACKYVQCMDFCIRLCRTKLVSVFVGKAVPQHTY
jgi:hypothetical protein